MLTQNYGKTAPYSHSKFFKFQIKKAKSPLNIEQKHVYQKQTFSLKRIKSAGKYKNINEKNHANLSSQIISNIPAYCVQQDQSQNLKRIFHMLRLKEQPTASKIKQIKEEPIQKQKCLQFSQKVRCKNGGRKSQIANQLNAMQFTEIKQVIMNRKQFQETQKCTSLIQVQNNKINEAKTHEAKQLSKLNNSKYVDEYELFSKIHLKNNFSEIIKSDSNLGNHQNQTTDSSNASYIQKINSLQKQVFKKNQLIKILQRRFAKHNIDGLRMLQRSRSITEKRTLIHQVIETYPKVHQTNQLKELQQNNKNLSNQLYYLQKRCQSLQKNNSIMNDELQLKQKEVRTLQESMLKVYQQNLKFLKDLESKEKLLTQVQAYKNQILQKNFDLQVSLQVIKQQTENDGKRKIQRKLAFINALQLSISAQEMRNAMKIFQNRQNCQIRDLDISRQIVKEVSKIQSKTKFFEKSGKIKQKRVKSTSCQNICILETNDELPSSSIYQKFYFQIGDLFTINYANNIDDYHENLLDQIEQFKNTITDLVKSIKILTIKVEQNKQRQKLLQQQLRIYRCKAQKTVGQYEKSQYLHKIEADIIYDQNSCILIHECEKLNQKYKVLSQTIY